MAKRVKSNQRAWLVFLIVVCMGVILMGGVYYVSRMRTKLTNQAIQNVMTVTEQQQQAFDNLISGDRERIHSFAEFFSCNEMDGPEETRHQLTLFSSVDATYTVICLDDGWFCTSTYDTIRQLTEEDLEVYRSLEGSGVRDSFTGLFSGVPRFGYYERFTFSNGHRGFIQKSYDRSKVTAAISLSFYGDQGLAYVVNKQGDILFRSSGMIGDHFYDNILEVVTGNIGAQEDIESLVEALEKGDSGSMVFSGKMGAYVYSYVPIEAVDGWFLISVVPMDAITEEADQILLDSQVALLLLAVVLIVCAVFVMLIWRTHKDIEEKDRTIEYQEQQFDIFSTYLSSNTNDVYMMVDGESGQVEYVSPNIERVLGVAAKDAMISLK